MIMFNYFCSKISLPYYEITFSPYNGDMNKHNLLGTIAWCAVMTGFSILTSCSVGQKQIDGELIGVEGREGYTQDTPYGMVTIPGGTFHMGQSDEDVAATQINFNKQVTIGGFYMDDSEITNNEYRQYADAIGGAAANQGAAAPGTGTGEGAAAGSSPGTTYTPEETAMIAAKKYLPDTAVWMRDFTFHMGDPMMQYYYFHPAFDDYPVVGVNWKAAKLFCKWRTQFLNESRIARGEFSMPNFRLPSEAEWEYAARGGRDLSPFPWGGPYIRNTKGCLLANFKPGRGNYFDDGFSYTAPVYSFFANDYGLYDMSGNVSEWVEDAFYEAAFPVVWDMNPTYFRDDEPRKVVRGGSWKDISYYLQTGTRTYEYQDSSKSYIGFRCAVTYLGRSSGDEF